MTTIREAKIFVSENGGLLPGESLAEAVARLKDNERARIGDLTADARDWGAYEDEGFNLAPGVTDDDLPGPRLLANTLVLTVALPGFNAEDLVGVSEMEYDGDSLTMLSENAGVCSSRVNLSLLYGDKDGTEVMRIKGTLLSCGVVERRAEHELSDDPRLDEFEVEDAQRTTLPSEIYLVYHSDYENSEIEALFSTPTRAREYVAAYEPERERKHLEIQKWQLDGGADRDFVEVFGD